VNYNERESGYTEQRNSKGGNSKLKNSNDPNPVGAQGKKKKKFFGKVRKARAGRHAKKKNRTWMRKN